MTREVRFHRATKRSTPENRAHPSPDRLVGYVVSSMIGATFVLLGLIVFVRTLGFVRGALVVAVPLALAIACACLMRLIRLGAKHRVERALAAQEHARRERAKQRRTTRHIRNREIMRLKRSGLPEQMKGMPPIEFERYVLDYFRTLAYVARGTPSCGDGGIDGIVEKNGERAYVQCKRWSSNVGVKEVREFLGVITKAGVRGYFVTTSGFVKQAREFAEGTDVELIDGEDLSRRIAALKCLDPETGQGVAVSVSDAISEGWVSFPAEKPIQCYGHGTHGAATASGER